MLKYGNKFHNYLLPITRDGISRRPLTSPVSEKEKLWSYKLSGKRKLKKKHMKILDNGSMTHT
jgi:hypothetical protein